MMNQSRVSSQEALRLYKLSQFYDLVRQAQQLTNLRHPGNIRTYAVERNINYTNVCQVRCRFCAFSVTPADPAAYVLSDDQIVAKIKPLIDLGGTQILLQGGLNPELPFDFYINMLKSIRRNFPQLHIHAFSPPEIIFFTRHFEMSIISVIQQLREAGLDSIPGGGAEILVDRVRQLISPAKCCSDEWLEVMRQSHQFGMCTTATMMFGHLETIAERIEHLERLRSLQDESLARQQGQGSGGYFTSFTCWPFQPGNTRLGRDDKLRPVGAFEQLRMTALSRIYLDNIPNIQASWPTQGPAIGQLSLFAGCNDAGSLMMEENVVAAAGTAFSLQLQDLRRMISNAGFNPVQRDYYYHLRADRPAAI